MACHIHALRVRFRLAFVLCALLAVLPALVPSATAAAAEEDASTVPLPSLKATTTQVAFGLRRPTAIAAPDDGTDRLFITEKSGTVRVINATHHFNTKPKHSWATGLEV